MEREGSRSSIPHVSALDGLRGVAVAGVLVFHGGHLLGGYLGVDLFFTLSGFLITTLLLTEAARTGHVRLSSFWARRARRLLPALAVLLAFVAIYCATLATPQQLTQIRGDALATIGYVANWRAVFAHQNYWALFIAPSPLEHTWSLAIEEQFYLLWPLLVVALLTRWKRTTANAVLVASLALAALSTVLMISLYHSNNTTRAYYGTDTRAAAILLGAALAAWRATHQPTTNPQHRRTLEAAGLAGVIVLAICWTRLDGQSPTLYHGGFLACALAATAIIATITHPQAGPLNRALSWKPLCALGLISYAVYLYHWPIDIVIDQHRTGLTGWPLFTLQTLITIAAATISYKLIEQPVRHGKLTKTQSQKLTPTIAIALTIAILTTTLGAQNRPTLTTTQQHPIAAATRAFRTAAPGSTRVMIVGNSVAYTLALALVRVHTKPPLAVLNASVPGCHFPSEVSGQRLTGYGVTVDEPPCHPSWEAGALAVFRPDIVLWIFSDPRGKGGNYRGERIQPCSAPWDSVYEHELRAEIARLGAGGAHVVFTTEAYSRYPGAGKPDRATDCNNQLRREVAATTSAQLVDLAEYICPDHQCRIKQDGVTLRTDGLHYWGAGGRIVAQWLFDQVKVTNGRR